ncbi:MAG: hypothetical protein EXS38_02760 [Opitutus sp.]|nr:hypothetical protein [Opitutus sp.]
MHEKRAPFIEYHWRAPQTAPTWCQRDFKIVDGKLRVPDTPGMGLEIDPDYLKGAALVAKIDRSKQSGGSGSGSGS